MAKPEAVLVSVTKHLGLGHTATELAQIARGPVFSRNSKFAEQAYSPEQREQESHGIEQRIAGVAGSGGVETRVAGGARDPVGSFAPDLATCDRHDPRWGDCEASQSKH